MIVLDISRPGLPKFVGLKRSQQKTCIDIPLRFWVTYVWIRISRFTWGHLRLGKLLVLLLLYAVKFNTFRYAHFFFLGLRLLEPMHLKVSQDAREKSHVNAGAQDHALFEVVKSVFWCTGWALVCPVTAWLDMGLVFALAELSDLHHLLQSRALYPAQSVSSALWQRRPHLLTLLDLPGKEAANRMTTSQPAKRNCGCIVGQSNLGSGSITLISSLAAQVHDGLVYDLPLWRIAITALQLENSTVVASFPKGSPRPLKKRIQYNLHTSSLPSSTPYGHANIKICICISHPIPSHNMHLLLKYHTGLSPTMIIDILPAGRYPGLCSCVDLIHEDVRKESRRRVWPLESHGAKPSLELFLAATATAPLPPPHLLAPRKTHPSPPFPPASLRTAVYHLPSHGTVTSASPHSLAPVDNSPHSPLCPLSPILTSHKAAKCSELDTRFSTACFIVL
ncbi:uncharacterized protein BDR25DRAFT_356312 [Lindgomyces ingoldianus]|uniref:Uncharacterized protein n=1 Tax=Lindgomyces ingoldianus TaxID=673940 RepID=A0ACB6QU19_9PLEO|nr:uncharacterized protein BDR25DRAFT_356312 [Lindgomyces ingoldianus]KAF2469580.1 hypothetical protein BDR25DRAFT_356312 [Lindgomyces ingoldianus]